MPAGALTEACPAGTAPGSTCIPGTRTVLNPAFFGPDGYFITIGNSNYNSLQVNLRHTSSRAQLLVGYTFSKSLDDASGYGEQINPVNARLSKGLSAFDVTNNFVASYNVNLPFDKISGPSRLTHGWAVSGITRFSTGVPVTLIETDDHSLLGTSFTGPQPLPVDTPDFAGGSVGSQTPALHRITLISIPHFFHRVRLDWRATQAGASSTGPARTTGIWPWLKTRA